MTDKTYKVTPDERALLIEGMMMLQRFYMKESQDYPRETPLGVLYVACKRLTERLMNE